MVSNGLLEVLRLPVCDLRFATCMRAFGEASDQRLMRLLLTALLVTVCLCEPTRFADWTLLRGGPPTLGFHGRNDRPLGGCGSATVPTMVQATLWHVAIAKLAEQLLCRNEDLCIHHADLMADI